MNNQLLVINPEVQEALEKNIPIVALESTIISHGMPYPDNVATALAVEKTVRENGAVPATIAIFNGKCHIGLTQEQIEYFGQAKDVTKVSIRDMGYVISQKKYGATTVAATMRLAHMVGINVFVTGGIGGVHRGGERSLDISADLTEMGQTSVAIVSAGVKSILDIGLTLEHLETLGVPVITIGQDELPCFYSSKSKFKSPFRLDTYEEIAAMMYTKWQLGLHGALLIANPVASDEEIPESEIEKHIQDALAAADQQNISGKDITPFLLKHIADNTTGESLKTNIALIINNAKAGAKLAVAYTEIK